jgi:hypothetical protein
LVEGHSCTLGCVGAPVPEGASFAYEASARAALEAHRCLRCSLRSGRGVQRWSGSWCRCGVIGVGDLSDTGVRDALPVWVVDDGQGRIAQRCGPPLASLTPGGVLVSWSSGGVPMTAQALANYLDTQPGTPIRVDGVPGKLAVSAAGPGDCVGLGASHVMNASLLRNGEWRISMQACLRGPKLAQHEAQVRAMLRSTRFPNGSE